MKKLILPLLILVIALGTFSCSKDQAIVKKLSKGEWEVTEQTINGMNMPDSVFSSTTYMFEECKVKKGACDGTYTTEDPNKGTVESSFTYSISDKGERITLTLDFFGLPVIEQYDILEHSDDRFVWYAEDEDGNEIETTIEKI